PKLRWSEFQAADSEFVGSGKCEKGADVKSTEERQQNQDLIARTLRQHEGVTDYHRTQEEIVEQVIHVISPPHQSRVAIFAELTVVVISEVVQHHHGRGAPQPAKVACRQEAETQNSGAPDQRQHCQVLSFKPGGNARQNYWLQLSFQRFEKRCVYFAGTGEFFCRHIFGIFLWRLWALWQN